LIRKVWAYVAAQLITAAARNASTMIVSAFVSPFLMPSSIARPAR
jgi:fructose-specific component phosphotransferase system IIB-like protein